MKLEFLTYFKKILKYQISWKMGAKSFHVGGWTNGQKARHDKANSRFLRCCEHT